LPIIAVPENLILDVDSGLIAIRLVPIRLNLMSTRVVVPLTKKRHSFNQFSVSMHGGLKLAL
jgi:hypothetical protein